jgi:sec-independent protein translocase protein TatA
MFAFLDPPEIILIIVVVLVLFGGSQLPKLAKNLGKAQQEFKSGLADGQKEKADKSDKVDTVQDKNGRAREVRASDWLRRRWRRARSHGVSREVLGDDARVWRRQPPVSGR